MRPALGSAGPLKDQLVSVLIGLGESESVAAAALAACRVDFEAAYYLIFHKRLVFEMHASSS